jgi:outer membrane protein TolC
MRIRIPGRLVVWTVLVALIAALAHPAAAQEAPRALTLADIVAATDQRNPAVAATRRAVEAAEASVRLARAGAGVTVSAQGSAGIVGGTTTTNSALSSSAGLSASYTIYDSGETAASVRQAEANLRSAQAALSQARQDTALAAAQAYVTLLRAQRAVDQNQQVVAQNQQLLRSAEAQFQAGAVARADVVRAQANLAAAEGDLIAARNAVDQATAGLNTVIGQGPLSTIAAASAPPVPQTTVAQAQLARLVEDRPEIRRAQADIDAATAAVAAAQAGGGLQVALSGGVTQGFTPTGQTVYSIGTNVSFPLFDGGRTSAQVAQAQANLAAAKARIESTRLAVQLQAVTALTSITSARARITSAQAGLAFAQESLRLSQGRYAAGAATILEVIDAQTALVQAQVALDNAQFDELAGVVSLRYALGRSVVDGTI